MPELPEVETTRRGLAQAIVGRRIDAAELRRRDLRFPLPDDFEARVDGRRITAVRRRAKYLLIDLDSGESILAHLGMSGSFRVLAAGEYQPKPHDHVLFWLEGDHVCVFHDPRRFGVMDLLQTGADSAHKLLANLGPEPLSDAFNAAYLAAQLARRSGPIKPTLMDQKLVVGVGNIYASEALHLAGINPYLSSDKAAKMAAAIVPAIRTTLEAAIASGGSTLRDYVGADGTGGYFQHHFHVYDRDGDPCNRCQTTLKMEVQTGRSTYWCPQCQPLRGKAKKH
jgi:formamidopyrimidine-DNA glycosylase